jgi:hypothetical protein
MSISTELQELLRTARERDEARRSRIRQILGPYEQEHRERLKQLRDSIPHITSDARTLGEVAVRRGAKTNAFLGREHPLTWWRSVRNLGPYKKPIIRGWTLTRTTNTSCPLTEDRHSGRENLLNSSVKKRSTTSALGRVVILNAEDARLYVADCKLDKMFMRPGSTYAAINHPPAPDNVVGRVMCVADDSPLAPNPLLLQRSLPDEALAGIDANTLEQGLFEFAHALKLYEQTT